MQDFLFVMDYFYPAVLLTLAQGSEYSFAPWSGVHVAAM